MTTASRGNPGTAGYSPSSSDRVSSPLSSMSQTWLLTSWMVMPRLVKSACWQKSSVIRHVRITCKSIKCPQTFVMNMTVSFQTQLSKNRCGNSNATVIGLKYGCEDCQFSLAAHFVIISTVKAFNFGSHGNFGPFFGRVELLWSKRVLQKNEWNKSCRRTFDLPSRFCSFLAQNPPELSTDMQEMVRSFHEVQS